MADVWFRVFIETVQGVIKILPQVYWSLHLSSRNLPLFTYRHSHHLSLHFRSAPINTHSQIIWLYWLVKQELSFLIQKYIYAHWSYITNVNACIRHRSGLFTLTGAFLIISLIYFIKDCQNVKTSDKPEPPRYRSKFVYNNGKYYHVGCLQIHDKYKIRWYGDLNWRFWALVAAGK